MFVISENEAGIDKLACLEYKNTLFSAYIRLQKNNEQHHYTHQVEQIAIAIYQYVIGYLLYVDRGRKPQKGKDKSPKKCLSEHYLMRSDKLNKPLKVAHFFITCYKAIVFLNKH